MKSKQFISALLVGIFWFLLNTSALADGSSADYYMQPLTSPAQIASKNGELEATISIDYNIAPTDNPIWGSNGTGITGSTTSVPYTPQNSASDAPNRIGPDVVALRNYTVQNVAKGSFTGKNASAKTPSSGNKSTWVTDLIGPTLRAKPGDTIVLHLINNLPDDRGSKYGDSESNALSCIGNTNVSDATCNMTNFHTHGLHDSPANFVKSTGEIASTSGTDKAYNKESDYWVSDDVIDSLLPGGHQWDIKIKIPPEHPAGTFWYHPHQHGATSVHLASGLEGAIIIDDAGPTVSDFNPDTKQTSSQANVKSLDKILKDAGIKDRLLMFQHLPYEIPKGASNCQDTPCEVGWTVDGAADANFSGQVFTGYTLVNGQTYPLIEMNTNDIERWRLINGGVAEPISLQIIQLSNDAVGDGVSINTNGTTKKLNLTDVLDELVAANRVPFLTTTKTGKPTNLDKVVIGGITPKKNKKPTDTDLWLSNPKTFGQLEYGNGSHSATQLDLNIIAYDGITTGDIDRYPSCPADGTEKYQNNPTVASDNGVYFRNCVTLGPGNRVDALIKPNFAGTWLLIKNANYEYLSQNGAATAEDIVAVLSVTGKDAGKSLPDESALKTYAEYQYYPPTPKMATATPTATHEAHFLFYAVPNTGPAPHNPKDRLKNQEFKIASINFGMAFNCKENDEYTLCSGDSSPDLDYEMFTENMGPIVLNKDELGEWTLKVEDNGKVQSAHPFHIHTNPFYLKEIQTCTKSGSGSSGFGSNQTYKSCHSTYPKRWQDTQLVQPNQIVTFRYQPKDYEGSFVFHCHFVDHEDQGMMRWVKVCGKDNKTCINDETYGLLPDFTNQNL